MTDTFANAGHYDDGLIDTNGSANPTMHEIVEQRYSRRQALFGGVSALTVAAFGGMLSGCGGDGSAATPTGTVSAGGSITTRSGKAVTLTGSVSGTPSNGGTWSQVSGPTTAITGIDASSVSIVAPSVTTATPLVFRYQAVGPTGIIGTSDTTITVDAAQIDFTAVPKTLNDIVTVPAGYTATVLYRLGDPTNTATAAYANDGTDAGFSARAGDHHDGMSFFGLAATGTAPDPTNSARGLLVLNHENITQAYLHPNGPTTVSGVRPEAEALKEMECHGVSVVEVTRGTAGTWSYVQAGALNRRVTPLTPTAFTGPVAGNAALATLFSPTGVAGRGTINNCANGYMPWGTYMTCEENWAGYFRRPTGDVAARGGATAKANVSLARYGIPENRPGNYGWATVTPADAGSTIYRRWNIGVQAGVADGAGDFRNEANQFGWVLEIDPFTREATPRKRTALGRMNHEGCWPGRTIVGVKPAFYMGDDAQNEYIYKFVSATPWVAADAAPADRLGTGDKYLDTGTLYVARFNADGSGQWLPLLFGQGPLTASNAAYAFADQADVLINARLAADALGATKMDRPEWTAVNPQTGEMYCTLTNNSSRTVATTDTANPRAYTDPKTTGGQTNGNPNGHIIRLRETGDTTEAVGFAWDIYAFGAGSDLDATNINLSGLDATNDFSSPDGLWFARNTNASGLVKPVLWIETDDGAYTDVTNCMLLAAQPGTVGDGGTRTIANTIGATTGTQTTRVGKAPGTTLRRFLVGPKECEITGIDTTPDGRSLFVNIQHPGENGGPANITSNWPANQSGTAAVGSRPRSATIVITKNDGGVVGL